MEFGKSKVMSEKLAADVVVGEFAVIFSNVTIGPSSVIGEFCVLGRRPIASAAMVRKVSQEPLPTSIGSGCSLAVGVSVYSDVIIGNDCLLGDHVSLFTGVRLGNRVLLSRNVTVNSDVTIGDDTRIMDNSHITGRSQIGKKVFISVGVISVNDNLFGKCGFSEHVAGCSIEDFASLGPGVILLPGAKVGMGSVVAAGSVVKDELPPGMLCAGNPAKPICRIPRHMRRELSK